MAKNLVSKITNVDGKFHTQIFLKHAKRPSTPYQEKGDFSTAEAATAWFQSVRTNWLTLRTPRLRPSPEQKIQAKEARRAYAAQAKALYDMPLKVLAANFRAEGGDLNRASATLTVLRARLTTLWEALAYELMEAAGKSEAQAVDLANYTVGRNWGSRFAKALTGELDAVLFTLEERMAERAAALARIGVMRKHKASPEAAELLRTILQIPGFKKITLVGSTQETVVFDVAEDGTVGYDAGHAAEFTAHLDAAMAGGGSMFIRQRVPDSKEMAIAANGKKMMLSWNALFAVLLARNRWFPISAEEVEYASTHDGNDNPLAPEARVVYRDFSEFCDAARAVPLM